MLFSFTSESRNRQTKAVDVRAPWCEGSTKLTVTDASSSSLLQHPRMAARTSAGSIMEEEDR